MQLGQQLAFRVELADLDIPGAGDVALFEVVQRADVDQQGVFAIDQRGQAGRVTSV